jgi:hypothetical protein
MEQHEPGLERSTSSQLASGNESDWEWFWGKFLILSCKPLYKFTTKARRPYEETINGNIAPMAREATGKGLGKPFFFTLLTDVTSAWVG